MKPILRVVLSWIALAAGFTSMALAQGPWLLIVAIIASHVLRHVLKPKIVISNASQRKHPVIWLSGIIALLVTLTLIGTLYPESDVGRIVVWCISIPMCLYVLYEDVRVSRQLQRQMA